MDARIGFFSFTEITDPGAHRAYNQWHQLDHLPEQYAIPGVAHGQRWVATPACRRARAVEGALATTHYVTLYLMGPPVAATLEAFRALAVSLHAEDRFFEPRRSHLSGPFEIAGSVAAPRVLVSATVVPLRPHRGVYVVVEEGVGASPPGVLEPLVELPGVAGAWSFRSTPELSGQGWDPGDRRVTVAFLDDDPLSVAPALGALVTVGAAPFPGTVVFAGPFETISPWAWGWFDEGAGPAGPSPPGA